MRSAGSPMATKPAPVPQSPLGRPSLARRPSRRATVQPPRALGVDDHNIILNLLLSSVCATVPAAISAVTSENRQAAIERLQTVEGAAPFAAAAAADAVRPSSSLPAPAVPSPSLSLLLSTPAVCTRTQRPRARARVRACVCE